MTRGKPFTLDAATLHAPLGGVNNSDEKLLD